LTYARALTQTDIDNMGLPKNEISELKPGWYWISSWPAFELGKILVIFTPFANPENDVAIFFKAQEIL
jgi:hypothetical protein